MIDDLIKARAGSTLPTPLKRPPRPSSPPAGKTGRSGSQGVEPINLAADATTASHTASLVKTPPSSPRPTGESIRLMLAHSASDQWDTECAALFFMLAFFEVAAFHLRVTASHVIVLCTVNQ